LEELLVEELESLAGLQAPPCLVLRDVLNTVRAEE